VLVRETKQSFKLFDVVFFCSILSFAGKHAEDRVSNSKNHDELKWDELQDLIKRG